MTRWTLSIPDETDRAVRIFLARSGGRESDLSRLVDEAVRRQVFDLTVADIKARMQTTDQTALLALIDDEVDAVRAARP